MEDSLLKISFYYFPEELTSNLEITSHRLYYYRTIEKEDVSLLYNEFSFYFKDTSAHAVSLVRTKPESFIFIECRNHSPLFSW